jgi:hypothetical protein
MGLGGTVNLRLYLDLQQRPGGELVCSMVALGPGGEEYLARREMLENREPREGRYAAYLALLEEAVLLEGHGLQILLGNEFRDLQLGFGGEGEELTGHSPAEEEICRRIRELSEAFGVISTSILSPHEPNPARAFLDPVGGAAPDDPPGADPVPGDTRSE